MMSVDQELCDYFKQGNFDLFMEAWKNQFEKLGTMGGVVVVSLTEDNREDLGDFLGVNFKKQNHIKVSWQKLKKIISDSRFEGANFKHVVELYFDSILLTKKSKKEINDEKTLKFFNSMMNGNISELARQWLEEIVLTKNAVYISVVQKEKDKNAYLKSFEFVVKALDQLPFHQNKYVSLAVFAAEITGDPHAFDQGSYLHFLLIQAITYALDILSYPSQIRSTNQKLYQAGLYKEDINNFCSIYGFSALKNDQSHAGWEGFYQFNEAWNANLNNIINIDKIDLKNANKVYIIENPSIYEALVQIVKTKHLPVGLVCSNGQPNQAVYAVLDKLEATNAPMFYAGDFDPEGLLIAQRLLNQYSNLDLWLYTESYYFNQKANKSLSARRISMLKNLEDKRLIELGELIEAFGVGYQENMLDLYINKIQSSLD